MFRPGNQTAPNLSSACATSFGNQPRVVHAAALTFLLAATAFASSTKTLFRTSSVRGGSEQEEIILEEVPNGQRNEVTKLTGDKWIVYLFGASSLPRILRLTGSLSLFLLSQSDPAHSRSGRFHHAHGLRDHAMLLLVTRVCWYTCGRT